MDAFAVVEPCAEEVEERREAMGANEAKHTKASRRLMRVGVQASTVEKCTYEVLKQRQIQANIQGLQY